MLNVEYVYFYNKYNMKEKSTALKLATKILKYACCHSPATCVSRMPLA